MSSANGRWDLAIGASLSADAATSDPPMSASSDPLGSAWCHSLSVSLAGAGRFQT